LINVIVQAKGIILIDIYYTLLEKLGHKCLKCQHVLPYYHILVWLHNRPHLQALINAIAYNLVIKTYIDLSSMSSKL